MTNLSTVSVVTVLVTAVLSSVTPVVADNDLISVPQQSTYTVTDLGKVSDAGASIETTGRPPSFDPNMTTAGSVLEETRWRAVLWKKGKPEYLEPRSDQESEAFSVNARGQVVGGFGMPHHPVLWDGGKRQDLGLLAGTDSGFASVISASGVILGQCSRPLTKNPEVPDSVPCIFDHGKVDELTTFGLGGSVAAVNDHRDIVGNGVVERSYPTAGDFGGTAPICHAILWSAGHTYDLGHLEDDKNSYAVDINNDGVIVGVSGDHAVVWRDKKIADLNKLIPTVPAWKLTDVLSIDDKGCIVVVGTEVLSRGRRLGETHYLRITPSVSH